MFIAIAVAVSVLLPFLFLVLSVPDSPFMRKAMAENGERFVATVELLVVNDNIMRARRLCAAVAGDIPLVRGIEKMLSKLPATSADLQTIADAYGENAEAAIQERRKFSFRRLARNVVCFGTPVALAAVGDGEQGWVVGPLTLSLLVMIGFAIAGRIMTAMASAHLASVGIVLRRCANTFCGKSSTRIDAQRSA